MGVNENAEPLYVCVHVPEFSVQALLRLRPELADFPVAVLAGDPPLEQVCSANAKAFQLGVAHGMTCAELDAFTGLHLLRRSPVEERHACAVLLEAAGAFTPRMEVQASSASTFVLVLDMTGTIRIFGPAPQSTASVAGALAALRFIVHVAASSNLHTAVCIAPSARKSPTVVPAGKESEYLRELPVAALSLTLQQDETLKMWGVHTLGELAELPEVELIVRLGQEGKRLWLLARGEHPHLMVPEEPLFSLVELIAFDAPVEMMDSLLFVLGPMLDQLLTRARNRALALASITVRLSLDGGGEHQRIIKPALPVTKREILLKLLHLDLQAHPPPAGVTGILVQAEPGDCSKEQLGLFTPQLPEPMRLDITLARIAALVGDDHVGRIKLLDTHRRDGFTMDRFTVPATQPKIHGIADRPVALRRCRPPLHLSVQREGQRLTSFSLQGKRYTVREAYGPWRRSGDWWSSEVWSLEEWDVQAAAPPDEMLLCVITHDLLRHQWQMDGMYD